MSLQYLPYAKGIDNHGAYVSQTDFVTGQSGFLTQLYGSTDGTKGYTETLYEPSPLNRITMQGAPGEDWQITENPVEFTYITNSSPVSSWRYVGNSTLVSVSYPVGSLFVKEITDEDNKEVKEYIDKLGNMVQQEVGSEKTRYCYDDKGLLRCVLQPGASSPGDVSLCFFYSYDEKRRLIEKLIPGKEPEFYVYDERNRVVLSQDGVLRTANKWQYTIYNSLNQPTVQGIWESSLSRSALASLIKNDINYISKQAGRVPYKYFYYNLYVRRFYIPLHSDAYDLDQVEATNNTGRLTSEKTNLLTSETGMDTCIMITYYYDKYGRLIQTAKDNHLGGKDYITNAYSFTGLVKQTRYRHIVEDNTYTDQYNDYDHRGRVMKIRHTINEGDTVLMAGNNYNEAGELIDTYLHSVSGSAFLQRLDFTYNIRGWLTQINDPASFTENDKFGLNLFYNMAPSGGSSLYNGNISGMEWGTPTNSSMLFRFSYDGLNRLVTADFNKSGYDSYAFDCAYEYYPGGNISVLRRRDSGGAYLDNLSYNYTGNRINYIMDYAGDVPGKVNYPGDEECNAFDYDDNGNVTYEPSRGIQLEYNLLNLPQEIDFNLNHKTNYFYTFNGEKVRRVVESNGTVTKTDYCGPFVHETVNGVDSLKYIITPMGRAVKNGSGWDYEYNLKDHLGNTRVVIHSVNGVAQIIQERHYFPYGMDMSELSSGTSTNKYLYNGKEYENDFDLGWYDYGARFYDAQIGRWHVQDAMADKHQSYTPYHYTFNNPVRFIDEFGLDTNIYVFDQRQRPSDNNKGNTYTASVFVEVDGKIVDEYSGSSYPNSVSNTDNSPSANTVNEGEYNYNNKTGHTPKSTGVTEKGLNVVNSSGEKKAPGTSPEGDQVTMTGVNVHSGYSNNGGPRSRGSLGCITIKPDEYDSFTQNFDWSGTNGVTGSSTGKIVISRQGNKGIVSYNEKKASENGAIYDPVKDVYVRNDY